MQDAAPAQSVSEWYRGKTVLVTGATGCGMLFFSVFLFVHELTAFVCSDLWARWWPRSC